MTPTALGLLLIAAVLHAIWNLSIKRAKEKQIFTWWALIVGVVCFSPFLVMVSSFPIRIWPYVVASAMIEAIYFIILIRAYENGDFSLVYPMARGSAPAFLATWAILFLGERPRLYGILGIALLVLGLIVVGSKSWWTLRKTSKLTTNGLGLALGVAFCISIYSVIDGAAVRIVAPLPYTVLIIGLSAVFVAPVVLARYGSQATITEWRMNWLRIIPVGLLSILTYILVLLVYAISRVSYAGAVREISIIFAAFMGWHWLGEDFGMIRLVGAVLIVAGILVIAVAG